MNYLLWANSAILLYGCNAMFSVPSYGVRRTTTITWEYAVVNKALILVYCFIGNQK